MFWFQSFPLKWWWFHFIGSFIWWRQRQQRRRWVVLNDDDFFRSDSQWVSDNDDDDIDDHSQVDILLFPEDGLSGFEFPKAHLAQPFLQRVQRIMMTMTIMMLNSTHLAPWHGTVQWQQQQTGEMKAKMDHFGIFLPQLFCPIFLLEKSAAVSFSKFWSRQRKLWSNFWKFVAPCHRQTLLRSSWCSGESESDLEIF